MNLSRVIRSVVVAPPAARTFVFPSRSPLFVLREERRTSGEERKTDDGEEKKDAERHRETPFPHRGLSVDLIKSTHAG